jgi:hypothetical protein
MLAILVRSGRAVVQSNNATEPHLQGADGFHRAAGRAERGRATSGAADDRDARGPR